VAKLAQGCESELLAAQLQAAGLGGKQVARMVEKGRGVVRRSLHV
jgi:hypothetical protein